VLVSGVAGSAAAERVTPQGRVQPCCRSKHVWPGMPPTLCGECKCVSANTHCVRAHSAAPADLPGFGSQ